MNRFYYALFLGGALCLGGCSDDAPDMVLSEGEEVENAGSGGGLKGFYVLNEGNMGTNKCTLDFFDYSSKTYYRNIYAENNPDQVMELGDSGNDMAVWKDRLYIVVNGSHKVEVLDAYTAKRIGQVDVASPRSLAFDGDNVYVTSYVGGTGSNGSVVRFDAKSLKVTGSVGVGNQPEDMVVTDGKLYVVNSYQFDGVWDNTISVVDLGSFTVTGRINGAVNMHHLRLDTYDNMWATSRGNYADVASSLTGLRKVNGEYAKVKTYDENCSNLAVAGADLYFYGVTYDAAWKATYSYTHAVADAEAGLKMEGSFITDGTQGDIQTPYALAVQPNTGEILITDARNYVSSGELRCYSKDGKLRWKVRTGDIPGHIAFLK
ncbi:MAG: PQQ-binding-like beta-propeller repeat protein [Muribaculum sp.]|nr:PQQ-binding-like beta-propeller repeat protein [Muribaculum sp.]